MSNIVEKKIEEYPRHIIEYSNPYNRGYNAGYDQAMQDFLEKAERWLSENSDKYIWYDEFYHRVGMSDKFIDDFKNYMQNAEI